VEERKEAADFYRLSIGGNGVPFEEFLAIIADDQPLLTSLGVNPDDLPIILDYVAFSNCVIGIVYTFQVTVKNQVTEWAVRQVILMHWRKTIRRTSMIIPETRRIILTPFLSFLIISWRFSFIL